MLKYFQEQNSSLSEYDSGNNNMFTLFTKSKHKQFWEIMGRIRHGIIDATDALTDR